MTRVRRLIYNDDGNDLFVKRYDTPEEFLAQRILPALNTQVDSIFYCTGVTTLYDHDTEVAERSDDLQDAMDFTAQESLNRRANMHMLRAAGVDSLSLVTERVHEAGLEVFWSHRINDIHDSFTDWLLSRWKREHPECMMGMPADMPRYGISHPRYMWSTLDFEKAEVLDYLYRVTEDVCRRYDVDGIEIDYLRNPLFFRPNLEYKPATREQVTTMTAFQRRLREMACREGKRRGRALLVATHTPLNVEKCLHVGIDIEQWLREGLLDVLVTGSGYQPLSMPIGDMVRLGHAHGVPVYPNISNSGMEQWGGRLEAWRGAAANVWRAGADGINLFNHFPGVANDPIFMTLGDPQTLAGLDKVFGVDNTREYFGCLEQAVVQSQILPVALDPSGTPRKLNLPIGDDLAAAARDGTLDSVVMRMQVSDAGILDSVEVRLNGRLLSPVKDRSVPGQETEPIHGGKGIQERCYNPLKDAEERRLTFRPEPSLYRVGDNQVAIRGTDPAGDGKRPAQLTEAEVHVKYRRPRIKRRRPA